MGRQSQWVENAGRWAVLAGAALCLAGRAGLVGTARAQNATTLKAFASEKHLGTAEQALVGVEVRDENGELVAWGTGFVLRCDGFIALPASLCAFGKNSKLHLTIVLYPGTEKETRKSAPWPYFGKIYRGEYAFPMGYTVAHLPNVHLPALRVATADILQTGGEVTLFWTERDAQSGKFSLPQSRAVMLAGAEAYPKDLTKFTPGAVLLAESQAGVPAGAVVVGPEGLGVGLVTPAPVRKTDADGKPEASASEGMSRFLSFSVLERITNCVSPIPMTDADFAKRHPVRTDDSDAAPADTASTTNASTTATASNSPANGDGSTELGADKAQDANAHDAMVTVPGGPILLPGVMQSLQPDMGNATVACVAPFQIDKYEVTNRQYAAFWQSLPEKVRKQKDRQPGLLALWLGDERPRLPARNRRCPGDRGSTDRGRGVCEVGGQTIADASGMVSGGVRAERHE